MTPVEVRAATGCTVYAAETFAPFLTESCEAWGITDPLCIAGFIAQAAFESAWFTRMEEDLNYTRPITLCNTWPKRFRFPNANELTFDMFGDGRRNPNLYVRAPERLANAVYGGRMGNKFPNDGWDYRGRGPGMLTGRDNYEAFEKASGMPAIAVPGVLSTPNVGCDAFGWFWKTHDLNRFALARDDAGLTRAINGGLTGFEIEDDKPLSDRLELLVQARGIFC